MKKKKPAVNKLESAIASRLYSDQLKKYSAAKLLTNSLRRNLTRKKYDAALGRKEESTFKKLEKQTTNVENILNQVEQKQKQKRQIESLLQNRGDPNLSPPIRKRVSKAKN